MRVESLRDPLNAARYRNFHPTLGRWIERDPAGYGDGVSLYEYVGSRPTRCLDPAGLVSVICRDGSPDGYGEDASELQHWTEEAIGHAPPDLQEWIAATPGVVTLTAVVNDANVFMDKSDTGEVDIGDLTNAPDEGPGSRDSMLIHALVEQIWIQLLGDRKRYRHAHGEAALAEAKMNGGFYNQEGRMGKLGDAWRSSYSPKDTGFPWIQITWGVGPDGRLTWQIREWFSDYTYTDHPIRSSSPPPDKEAKPLQPKKRVWPPWHDDWGGGFYPPWWQSRAAPEACGDGLAPDVIYDFVSPDLVYRGAPDMLYRGGGYVTPVPLYRGEPPVMVLL